MIDLDVRGGPPPETGGPERSGRPRRPRRGWVAAVAAAVLLTTGGAGAPAPLDPVLQLPGDGVLDVRTDGGAAYLLRREELSAYRIAGGARSWTTPVPPGSHLVAAEAGRVLLAADETPTLTALDAATGRTVWRRDGFVPSISGTPGGSGIVITSTGETSANVGVDLRTGDVRWTLEVPPGAVRTLVPADDDRYTLADLETDGTLRVYRPETAAVLRTVRLDAPDPFHWFDIAGERLMTFRTTGEGGILSVTVYDLGTGRRLWRRDNGSTPEPIRWCGPMVCAGDSTSLAVLDPDTGRERWHLSGRTDLGSFDPGYLLAAPSVQNTAEPELGLAVLDPWTGRTLRRIPDWYITGFLGSGALLVTTRLPGGDALLGRLDPRTGRVRVFARARNWYAVACYTSPARLACQLPRVAIWTIPDDLRTA